jgi:uncharacterized protein (DUF983 family)
MSFPDTPPPMPQSTEMPLHAGATQSSRPYESAPAVTPLSTLLLRALRLRCPVCGQGRLFRNWISMHPRCEHCNFCFERGPGFWLGSIYVNYGLTALLTTAIFFGFFLTDLLSADQLLWMLTAFCLLFPLWFFRYARSIWLAFDVYFDRPRASESQNEPQDGRAES